VRLGRMVLRSKIGGIMDGATTRAHGHVGKGLVIGLLSPLAVIVFVTCTWFLLCPAKADANGPRYVFWKWGLYPFDPQVVYGSMVADKDRESIVIGRTVEDLERRFGLLRTAGNANEYQRYYSDRAPRGSEVRWLGDSPWLVELDEGRAVQLRLIKE
jgi:hypothetical protein